MYMLFISRLGNARLPWYAKAVAAGVAAYALSPIDLTPDFVPILGYVDDLFIVPLCIVVAIKLIPAEIMAEHRRTQRANKSNRRAGPAPSV
jgi:uncharacterized membrane protein YkvA (DUF1232 family)